MKIPIKTLDNNNEKLLRKKKREEEKNKRKEEYEKIDNENENNITNILYQISKFDDFLNSFSNYLQEVNLDNIINDIFFNEIIFLNQSIEELNSKITIFENEIKKNLEKNIKIRTTTKENSEQRTIIYNQCFEQYLTILQEIKTQLFNYLTQKKIENEKKEEEEKKIKKENEKIKMVKKSTKKFSKQSLLTNEENFDEEIDEEANLDTENSKPIGVNLIKANHFNVEKPHEENLKYTMYKEKSAILIDEDELEFDIKQGDISKIIIGEIEPFRDIIEADKINLYKHQRSKSSFNLKSKISKKKFNFENVHILEEGNQIEDLEGEDSADDNLSEINDNFEEDEIIAFGDNKCGNQRLLPYHISKISFCKKFEESNLEMINENEPLLKRASKFHKNKSKSRMKFNKSKSKINNQGVLNKNEKKKNIELKIERTPSEECNIF